MQDVPRRTVDRIVDPGYLADLQAMPIDELRRKKGECEALEAEVSYARRLIQGKLDLLRYGAERLAAGDSVGVTEMVGDLPGILSDSVGGSARLSRILTPAHADNQRREVERLTSTTDLAHLEQLSAEDLDGIVARLDEAEKETSLKRRRVQQIMDQLTGELIRRYREGDEDPIALLGT